MYCSHNSAMQIELPVLSTNLTRSNGGRTLLDNSGQSTLLVYNEVLFCSEVKLNPADVHTAYLLNIHINCLMA
jgi:hypothetical protein